MLLLFLEQLFAFFAESNAGGQKLIGCITSEKSSVADIAANSVKSVTTCAKDEISNFVSDLTSLVKDLARTANKTSVIAKDLDNCIDNDTGDILCAIQVSYIYNTF